jgi:hypothetical protein
MVGTPAAEPREALSPHHLAGMLLIGLGLAAIDGRPLRRLARPL